VSVEVQTSATEVAQERRTAPVELLWDLVFVFAVTQVTALLAHHPSWSRFGEAMLALALVWWAWSAFVWAANAQDPDSRALRASLLAGTVLIFIAGLALPQAFGSESLLFAVAYALVRFLHLALYADASRKGNASWAAIAGFAVTVVVGMALLVVGAFLDGLPRALLWTAAVAIDYAGPAWLTRERLRGLQEVAVAHFAERYGLFVIICLGESVVALGAGVGIAGRNLTAALVFGSALALLITVGLWWTYFDRVAERAEAQLRKHADPVLAAADGYSYIHLVIVAGIIIFDGGVKLFVQVHNSATSPMPGPGRLAMCGGVAVYLLGLAGFRLRMFAEVSWGLLAGAAALFVVYALGGSIPAWSVGAAIAAVVGALGAVETRRARAETEAELRTGPGPELRTGPGTEQHAEAGTEPPAEPGAEPHVEAGA
jgi:low temperature requirement protein LtrA